MMKHSKLLFLLILICLLMLPAFATAETQEEFELRCFKKTAAAATVYSYLNSSEGEVIDYIPAGTYVQCKSSTRDGRTTVVYMKNGVKKQVIFVYEKKKDEKLADEYRKEFCP